ncbi:hypothetical protein VNO77_21366 [Canavalia gladiata]|uniref:Uncharacterized protein n=1 Tax=Canavalia gladiata TaxID=3824 RepID=A0AAN9LVK1_CANGL
MVREILRQRSRAEKTRHASCLLRLSRRRAMFFVGIRVTLRPCKFVSHTATARVDKHTILVGSCYYMALEITEIQKHNEKVTNASHKKSWNEKSWNAGKFSSGLLLWNLLNEHSTIAKQRF